LAKQVAAGLNEFASTVDFGKGKWILAGEGTWLRTIPAFNTLTNVVGIVSHSSWPELNAVGKYYGLAGVELKLFNAVERSQIENNFTTCYTNIKNGKYREAHDCYEAILNFVEYKGNDHNLYNVNQTDSLIPQFALVQYYLSLPATVALLNAPTSMMFEQQTRILQANIYVDEAKNYTKDISDYLTANANTKILFVSGAQDFVTYSHAVSNWTVSELSFPESAAYVKADFTVILLNYAECCG
jgi:hypothetical protein